MIARRGSGWPAATLLLAMCLALGAFIYVQLRAAPQVPPVASGTVEAPALAALPAQPRYVMAPLKDFSAVIERPLFSPTRRPPEQGTVAVATPEPELKVTLVGVIITADGQIAIIKPMDGGRLSRLSLGDSFQGWVLDSIEPSRVTFRRGEVAEHIELTFDLPPPIEKPQRRKRQERDQSNQRNQAPAQPEPETRQN